MKHSFWACLSEVDDYFCTCRDSRCGKNSCKGEQMHYDFGWRFCAACNNLKLKLCGRKHR